MKRDHKKLTLRRDTVRNLSPRELRAAGGGYVIDTWTNPDQTVTCACTADSCACTGNCSGLPTLCQPITTQCPPA